MTESEQRKANEEIIARADAKIAADPEATAFFASIPVSSAGSILTLSQYAAREWDRMRSKYGVALVEARSLYPAELYRSEWWRYVLDEFEAGDDFSPQALVSFTQGMLRDLSRTTRGLREGLPRFYLLAGARKAA